MRAETALLLQWANSSANAAKTPSSALPKTAGPRPLSPPFQLDTIVDDTTGRTIFSFNRVALSDIHLYTKQCRAKRTSHFLENMRTNELMLVGDVVDGEHMREKDAFHAGPHHTQVVGHFIRKGAEGTKVVLTPGNHDDLLRKIIRKAGRTFHRLQALAAEGAGLPRGLQGFTAKGIKLFGVLITPIYKFTDKEGYRTKVLHSDQMDPAAVKNQYGIGGKFQTLGANIDAWVQHNIPGCENFSILVFFKKHCKKFIDRQMGISERIEGWLDRSPLHDAVLHGHDHMEGITRTAGGKLRLNSGSCTDRVTGIVYDHNDVKAVMIWDKDRITLKQEGYPDRVEFFKGVGKGEMLADPALYRDKAVLEARRAERLMARAWPARDRTRQLNLLERSTLDVARLWQPQRQGPPPGHSNRVVGIDCDFKAWPPKVEARYRPYANPVPHPYRAEQLERRQEALERRQKKVALPVETIIVIASEPAPDAPVIRLPKRSNAAGITLQ